MPLHDLIPTLQLAIGPVILISGVGLILLSMTNRFARVIDRARLLSQGLGSAQADDREKALQQLRILARRARLIRTAIALASVSVLLAAILIISLFIGALFQLAVAPVIVTLFIICMLTLIASLVVFIADIDLSLRALWLVMPPEAQRTSDL